MITPKSTPKARCWSKVEKNRKISSYWSKKNMVFYPFAIAPVASPVVTCSIYFEALGARLINYSVG